MSLGHAVKRAFRETYEYILAFINSVQILCWYIFRFVLNLIAQGMY